MVSRSSAVRKRPINGATMSAIVLLESTVFPSTRTCWTKRPGTSAAEGTDDGVAMFSDPDAAIAWAGASNNRQYTITIQNHWAPYVMISLQPLLVGESHIRKTALLQIFGWPKSGIIGAAW